jgi:Flp pilus assembly protein TadG
MARAGRVRGAAAAAELAAVLPCLVLLVLGGVDFGRFSHVHTTVTNAARAGGEFAGTHPVSAGTFAQWEQQLRDTVIAEMSGLDGFDPARLTVTATVVAPPGDLKRIRIDVSYPFETVVDWPGLPSRTTLGQTVTVPASR